MLPQSSRVGEGISKNYCGIFDICQVKSVGFPYKDYKYKRHHLLGKILMKVRLNDHLNQIGADLVPVIDGDCLLRIESVLLGLLVHGIVDGRFTSKFHNSCERSYPETEKLKSRAGRSDFNHEIMDGRIKNYSTRHSGRTKTVSYTRKTRIK